MSIYVLDSSAMMAYLLKEQGYNIVADMLTEDSSQCFAHSLNLCEVYYGLARITDSKRALSGIVSLLEDGVVESRSFSRKFWTRAGDHKSRGRISLADCVCISLAQALIGEVITSDHKEFDPIVPLGIVPKHFIR